MKKISNQEKVSRREYNYDMTHIQATVPKNTESTSSSSSSEEETEHFENRFALLDEQ